jgi:hypothetical protein
VRQGSGEARDLHAVRNARCCGGAHRRKVRHVDRSVRTGHCRARQNLLEAEPNRRRVGGAAARELSGGIRDPLGVGVGL